MFLCWYYDVTIVPFPYAQALLCRGRIQPLQNGNAYINTRIIFLAKIAEVYPIGIVKYAPGTFASFIAIILGFNLLTSLGILNFLFILVH